ncbi:F0F1 ATP synthase subunit delta [Clostridia bacterium]|nr:F0F1 ATP synthase subunit delta [Clostridia bacterium]
MAKLVSKTYGDALFELAVESSRMDELLAEVEAVSAILAANGEFLKLMNHPKIVKEEKQRILDEVFAGQISKGLMGFMRVLVLKDRYDQVESVFSYFVAQVKEYKSIGTAVVSSAFPLTEIQKWKIEDKLLKTTKYVSFDISYQTDESLIGGMIIRIGDRVVDSSVSGKLARLRRELSKIQLKAGECTP